MAITITAAAIAATVVVAGCGGGAGPAGDASPGAEPHAPRHLIYLSEFRIRTVLERLLPHGPGPLERLRTFRQMPANQTILPPPFRLGRLDGDVLAPLPPKEIARRLRTAINGTCNLAMPCRSHLVAIDDVSTEFRGRGGARLRAAMALLNAPSPWGGTYAERVMMYVPIQMMRGLQQEPARWNDARHAVAAGESYWLEMYESLGVGVMGDVAYSDWTQGVRATVGALEAAGGAVGRTHFMVGPSTGPIEGMPSALCPTRRGCAWYAAHASALNRHISRNGVGVYRFGPSQLQQLCVATHTMHSTDDVPTRGAVIHLCKRWTMTAPQPTRN